MINHDSSTWSCCLIMLKMVQRERTKRERNGGMKPASFAPARQALFIHWKPPLPLHGRLSVIRGVVRQKASGPCSIRVCVHINAPHESIRLGHGRYRWILARKSWLGNGPGVVGKQHTSQCTSPDINSLYQFHDTVVTGTISYTGHWVMWG